MDYRQPNKTIIRVWIDSYHRFAKAIEAILQKFITPFLCL
jgi:hypothetical protein